MKSEVEKPYSLAEVNDESLKSLKSALDESAHTPEEKWREGTFLTFGLILIECFVSECS